MRAKDALLQLNESRVFYVSPLVEIVPIIQEARKGKRRHGGREEEGGKGNTYEERRKKMRQWVQIQ